MDDPPRKQYRLREKPKPPSVDDNAYEEVDVADILKANVSQQMEKEAPIELHEPKSRRKRDYILGMVLGNLLWAIPPFVVPSSVPISQVMITVFSFSAMALFSIAFTWIMWWVVSDY